MKVNVYLPDRFREPLKARPDVHISRVCQDALAKVLDLPSVCPECGRAYV